MIRSRGDRARFALLCVLAVTSCLQPCYAYALEARASNITLPSNGTIPNPVSVAPDQNWEGIDGKWNTFSLRLGNPAQNIRVFASTASQQVWTVNILACMTTPDDGSNQSATVFDPTCFDSRGRAFNTTTSNTWHEKGYYQLWLEKNLGMLGNGLYGFDDVGLGLPGEEGPTIKNTTIGTLISPNFWLGHFGLHAKPTNFSMFEDPEPSYMTDLYNERHIPSLSFGYTAGAQYYDATFLGSLTLGGYDASRFTPNDLTFGFAPDNERDIVVGVVGIKAKDSTRSEIDLLARDSFTMYIDSTVAELWLPKEVCKAFENAFGLKYDNETDLYLLDDLQHQTLLAQNPSVTFSLGQKYKTDVTVDITLPYAAFDLEASPPYRGLENGSRYFPIRRGDGEKQWVLGRTFLQEAYLIVDWERQNFSVFPCNWTYGAPKDIVPILSREFAGEDSARSSSGAGRLSTGAIIGIALGCGFLFALIVCALIWVFWRRRSKRKLEAVKAQYEAQATTTKEPSPEIQEESPISPTKDGEEGTNVFPKAELPAETKYPHELSTDSKEGEHSSNRLGIPSPAAEVDNTERQIFEMLGDIPTRQEAGGRQLSEKESMVHRERIYNGVDPNGPPDVSPMLEDGPPRLAPLSPSEVAMVNRRLPNISPTTPRTPRDGAYLEASDTFFQPPPPRAPRDGRHLEVDDTLLSPISPLEGSTDTSRRRFSYES